MRKKKHYWGWRRAIRTWPRFSVVDDYPLSHQTLDGTEVVTIQGYISNPFSWESEHVRIDGEPLAELAEDFTGKMVTLRYWISDTPVTKEEAVEENVKQAMGFSEAKFQTHYSEVTGYLFTDEEFVVGGHDMISEIDSFQDKYLLMEVTIHND